MMKRILTKEPLRCFLLLWIAMSVVGALLGWNMQEGPVLGSNSGPRTIIPSSVYFVALPPSPDNSTNPPHIMRLLQSGIVLDHTLPLSSILIFLLLAALYSFLLWRGLSERVQPRFFWLYFLLQGLLVAVMQWILEEPYLALNFYLVLTLCAVAMFKRAAPVLLVGTSGLLLFFVLLGISIPNDIFSKMHLAALWLNIWSFSDLTTIVFLVLGYLILYTQQSQSQRQLKQAHLELQGAHSRLAASSRQIETLTLLTERQRIARELHDTLAQEIAGMIMQLEVTSAQMDRQNYPQAQQILSQTLSSARTALVDARHAIRDLRSRTPHIDQFVASIQEEIAHFFQMTGIVCHTRLDDLVHTPPQHCEHVLRVIGEGLSNVGRHAQARHVSVEASVVERWLEISVRDDGQGFDPASLELHTGHYGLLGLQERAHLVGGTLSLSSTKGAGTTLRFCVPLDPPDSPAFPLKQESLPSLNFQEHTYA